MWPWRKQEAPPEVPDELLGTVQRGVVAAIGALGTQLSQLAAQLRAIDENATAARSMEVRLMKVDTLAHSTRSLLNDEVARIDAAVNQLRGSMTGALRGGRRDRSSEELGAALISSLGGSLERAQQLVQEVQRAAAGNGVAHNPDASIGG